MHPMIEKRYVNSKRGKKIEEKPGKKDDLNHTERAPDIIYIYIIYIIYIGGEALFAQREDVQKKRSSGYISLFIDKRRRRNPEECHQKSGLN